MAEKMPDRSVLSTSHASLVVSFVSCLLSVLASCGGGGGITGDKSDGGDGGANVCATSGSCGGDIGGTWTAQTSCLSIMGTLSADCPAGRILEGQASYTGTVTYKADGTYTGHLVQSGSSTTTLPASCLSLGSTTLTCDQLTTTSTPGVAVTCQGTSECACTLTLTNKDASETGTYTIAEGILTETSSKGTVTRSHYCVTGTSLTITPLPTVDGQTVSGSVVLSKS